MVDMAILDKIDRLELSERAARLRKQYFDTEPRVCGERVLLTMESWKETEGEPIALRRAKMLKRITEKCPVTIFPGQRLAGNHTRYFRGTYPHPEFDTVYLHPLLQEQPGTLTLAGEVERARVASEDWTAIIEGVKFWEGKGARDKSDEVCRDIGVLQWWDDVVEAGNVRYEIGTQVAAGGCWRHLIKRGLSSYIREAEDHIRHLIENRGYEIDKLEFWPAAIIACQAAITLGKRYAQCARELAVGEKDPAWRAELEQIAESCERVPEKPPRTFREGLQCLVLTDLALNLENGLYGPGSWGNVDQYLYPLFKRDLEEGRLTLEDAADLIFDLFLYGVRKEQIRDLITREYQQRSQQFSSMGLGGTEAHGNDTTSELSYLFLHVCGLAAFPEPHVVIRWHKGMPSWFTRKAIKANCSVKGGVPQFQNSDHIVEYMVSRGISLESAREWVGNGCSQTDPGDGSSTLRPSYFNIALCVDLALHNGVASKTGKKIGVETGDPRRFQSSDELYDAFTKQVDHLIRKTLWYHGLVDRVRPQYYREVLASTLAAGCLERGLDYDMGGLPHYRFWIKKDRAIVPAADSLIAIKKLVYDEKKLTMSELIQALDTNFEGAQGEEIRRLCLAAPKYGNDVDEVDEMVRRIAKFDASVIHSEKNVFGDYYAINRNGQAYHYIAGKRMGALPNGRKAGEPLADGSLSAMQGMDRRGPTALLNSALKADFKEGIAGIMTVKIPASIGRTEEGREKVRALTEGFLQAGGTYIQYNIVDAQMLREAKLHPEKYRDLVVRVGGYSAYFINLSPTVQDEIIARTEQQI